MPKFKVAIGRPTGNGWERVEVGNFLAEIAAATVGDPKIAPYIDQVFHIPVQRFPTDIGRNVLVKVCQERQIDYLLMIDNDASPLPGTFQGMFLHALQHDGPCVIGVPYVASDETIQVFHFQTKQPRWGGSGRIPEAVQPGGVVHVPPAKVPPPAPLDHWEITRYTRDLAACQKGFGRVCSVGTHVILFDMRAFAAIGKPYFQYSTSEDGSEVLETEDCWCSRQMFNAGIPIYCAWDFPAGHFKELRLDVPKPLPLKEIPAYFLDKARVALQNPTPESGQAVINAGANDSPQQHPVLVGQ